MIKENFKIGGFREISTGPRDYGKGILRFKQDLFARLAKEEDISRHSIVSITTDDYSRSVFGFARPFPDETQGANDSSDICMEYDDRLGLGLTDKGNQLKLILSKAGPADRIRFLLNHPDVIVRMNSRFTFWVGAWGAVVSALLGVAIALLLSK